MEAVVFIGIQASGKTSFFMERFAKTHIRVNLDMLNTRRKEALLLDACIEMPHSFVVDNTNPTMLDRRPYIEKAKANGLSVVGYYFNSSIKPAIARNGQRSGKEKIPDVGIRATHAKMELPNASEGFDSLFYVSIGEDGKFIVSKWDKADEV